jgi:hypothetical protein
MPGVKQVLGRATKYRGPVWIDTHTNQQITDQTLPQLASQGLSNPEAINLNSPELLLSVLTVRRPTRHQRGPRVLEC